MFVYVTYDPLLEKVLCVHDKPNQFCSVCKPVWKQRERDNDYAYQIYEEKRKLRKFIEIKNKPQKS